jgi:hypothetical protein
MMMYPNIATVLVREKLGFGFFTYNIHILYLGISLEIQAHLFKKQIQWVFILVEEYQYKKTVFDRFKCKNAILIIIFLIFLIYRKYINL